MSNWTLTFLVFALINGVLVFAGTTGAVAAISNVLCVVFIVLFLSSLLVDRRRGA